LLVFPACTKKIRKKVNFFLDKWKNAGLFLVKRLNKKVAFICFNGLYKKRKSKGKTFKGEK